MPTRRMRCDDITFDLNCEPDVSTSKRDSGSKSFINDHNDFERHLQIYQRRTSPFRDEYGGVFLIRKVKQRHLHAIRGFQSSILNLDFRGFRDITAAQSPKRASRFSSGNCPAISPEILLTDGQAASRSLKCFKQFQHQLEGRVLQNIILQEQYLERNVLEDTLESIRIATNKVFFDGALNGRVKWRWSKVSEYRYRSELLGTTRPRHSWKCGFEAQIILSAPLLLSGRYRSDLVFSTFIHELVHCYFFICCGFSLHGDGGHSPGFVMIMKMISDWTGNSRLRLCSMKANLDHFLVRPFDSLSPKDNRIETLEVAEQVTTAFNYTKIYLVSCRENRLSSGFDSRSNALIHGHS